MITRCAGSPVVVVVVVVVLLLVLLLLPLLLLLLLLLLPRTFASGGCLQPLELRVGLSKQMRGPIFRKVTLVTVQMGDSMPMGGIFQGDDAMDAPNINKEAL